MPSFFESLKRFALGQPVFTKEDAHVDGRQMSNQDTTAIPGLDEPEQGQQHDRFGTPLDASGRKIMPVVIINEIKCHENGTDMECWGVIKNTYNEPVELEKITVLSEERELMHQLSRGEEREFLLYKGRRPTNTSQTRCELTYKNETGDYFCADHFVEFDILHDNTCAIKSMRFVPPVRDI